MHRGSLVEETLIIPLSYSPKALGDWSGSACNHYLQQAQVYVRDEALKLKVGSNQVADC